MEDKNNNGKFIDPETDIEVVIGDSSELNFSEVNDFVDALKPSIKKNNKAKIIIPTAKKSNKKENNETTEIKNDDENDTENNTEK